MNIVVSVSSRGYVNILAPQSRTVRVNASDFALQAKGEGEFVGFSYMVTEMVSVNTVQFKSDHISAQEFASLARTVTQLNVISLDVSV